MVAPRRMASTACSTVAKPVMTITVRAASSSQAARAARNPRILLSYGAAFIARADMSITGMFMSLWAIAAAPDAGFSTADALARGGLMLGIVSLIGMIWVGVFGWLLDKVNRVTGVAIAMGIAGAGYLSMLIVTSPLAGSPSTTGAVRVAVIDPPNVGLSPP